MSSKKSQTKTHKTTLGAKKTLIGFALFLAIFGFSAYLCTIFSSEYVKHLQLKDTVVYVPAVVTNIKESFSTNEDGGEYFDGYDVYVSYKYNGNQYTDVYYDSVKEESSVPENVTIAISSAFPQKKIPSQKSIWGMLLFLFPSIICLIAVILTPLFWIIESHSIQPSHISVDVACEEMNRSVKSFRQTIRLALLAYLVVFFGDILSNLSEKYGLLNVLPFAALGLLVFGVSYALNIARFVKPKDFSIRTETYLGDIKCIDDDGNEFFRPSFSNIGTVDLYNIRRRGTRSTTAKCFEPGDVAYIVMKHGKRRDTVVLVYPAKEFVLDQNENFSKTNNTETPAAFSYANKPPYTDNSSDNNDPFIVDDPFEKYD